MSVFWVLKSILGRDDLAVIPPIYFLSSQVFQTNEALSCDGISPLWAWFVQR